MSDARMRAIAMQHKQYKARHQKTISAGLFVLGSVLAGGI
jgi:hypothetical protein